MKKVLYFGLISFSLIAISCNNSNKYTTDSKDSIAINLNNSNQNSNWYDELIIKYINQSDNEFIKLSRKDSLKTQWLLDNIEVTDTAKYFIFHLGHDVSDKGGKNRRFVTDAWIYIDSLKRKIYEYDLPNDTLIEWKK